MCYEYAYWSMNNLFSLKTYSFWYLHTDNTFQVDSFRFYKCVRKFYCAYIVFGLMIRTTATKWADFHKNWFGEGLYGTPETCSAHYCTELAAYAPTLEHAFFFCFLHRYLPLKLTFEIYFPRGKFKNFAFYKCVHKIWLCVYCH